jgi:hypothetical protein
MKSKLNLGKVEDKVKYPCLKQYNADVHFIVLFVYPNAGTVIWISEATEENCVHDLGEYKTNWIEEDFLDFTGEVVLSN